ncbi:MAG: hypothetical protein BGO43_09120 [Gammaproteobacteria bacterium 39-13]|nr:hypothetical protein [Gammaproteobacteria bacterium]OJV94079.1 MAG: hypothetical protein BGO43_09120 [Gammaproteobacteria bacterium 39-13]
MTDFKHLFGRVYILENEEAKRVKVGMTINCVEKRLEDVNNMWLGIKGTCQICGGRRLVNHEGFIPKHVVSCFRCPGSNSLPFEKDSSLAISYLIELKKNHGVLKGSQNSNSKRINGLEERIRRFQALDKLLGKWKVNTVYQTNSAEDVELRSHEILSDYLCKDVPFGEVFICSVAEATNAVELVLNQLDLLQSAKKEVLNT